MSELTTTETIKLEQRRCWRCGRWWAYEYFGNSSAAACPVCAQRDVDALSTRIDELTRSNASLRGAITKAKDRQR